MLFRANHRDNLSLPSIFFINDFRIYRKNYRALKAFSWIPGPNLPYEERRKIANNFTLTLGPHGANIEDVVDAIAIPVHQLNEGISPNTNNRELYLYDARHRRSTLASR